MLQYTDFNIKHLLNWFDTMYCIEFYKTPNQDTSDEEDLSILFELERMTADQQVLTVETWNDGILTVSIIYSTHSFSILQENCWLFKFESCDLVKVLSSFLYSNLVICVKFLL